MSKAKNILFTVAASFAAGAIVGMLYAPDKGVATRKKINRLVQKCGCCGKDDIEDYDKETLEELSVALQEQLDKVNKRLEQ